MKRQSTTTYRKQGPYKRTRYSKGSSARNPIVIPDTQVRRMLNYRTAGLLGIERKYFDTIVTSNSISAVGTLTGGEVDPGNEGALNNPAQGDGAQNRDGRQITMDNITVKGNVSIPSQTFTAETVPEIFIAMVLDKQTNGTAINSEDVFTNPSGSSVHTPFCFRNMEYASRFTILKTVRISANQWGEFTGPSTVTYGRSVSFSMFHDFKGKKVNFAPGVTTATISAVADNSVHMIAFANGNTMNPVINYTARMRFRG